MPDPALGAPANPRHDLDSYFTIESKLVIDALTDSISLGQCVLEPAAGRGHLVKELRGRGYDVTASDVLDYGDPLVNDISPGIDIMQIVDLTGIDAIVTNLPYRTQDMLLAHLLPIAKRNNIIVATLTRSTWHYAKRRRALVADNPCFFGIVHLPRRPWWSETERTSTPRFDFVWNVWIPFKTAAYPRIFYPMERL